MCQKSYTCIYCTSTKYQDKFNTEHVIPKALGTFGVNTPTLNNVVCQDCNQKFGDGIDLVLNRGSSSEVFDRFKFGIKDPSKFETTKYGKNTIHIILEGKLKGLVCKLRTDPSTNNFTLIPKEHDVGFKTSEGNYKFYSLSKIPTKDELKVKYGLDKPKIIIFSQKIAIAEVIQTLKEKYGKNVEYEVYSTQKDLSVNTVYQCPKDYFRAITKIAFNYLFYSLYKKSNNLVEVRDIVLQECFNPIRTYILEGIEPSWNTIKRSHKSILPEQDGKAILAHIITIDYSLDYAIIASVALFNRIHFQICLAPQYAGLKLELGHGHGFSFDDNCKKVFDIKKSPILRPQSCNLILPSHFNGKSLLLL